MDIKTALDLAGGQSRFAYACKSRLGIEITRSAVNAWACKNKLPNSEWTGKTQYSVLICDLANAFGHNITPIELCPGAGQYMSQPDEEAA